MKQMIQQQRFLLATRMEVLSGNLKQESDSLRAETILQEMRNISALLEELADQVETDYGGSNLCQQNVF